MPYFDDHNFVPESSPGYLVRGIAQATRIALEPVFAAEGLTQVQWSALVSIWSGRGTTCAGLARDLDHDAGAMTRLVDALEARGWVTRRRNPEDRRLVDLALTDAGSALAMRCRARVWPWWNAALAGWDDEDVATLVRLLGRLRETVSQAEPAAA